MATIKTNELSAYTIAKNCSDLSDVNAGMDELKDYFTACEKASKQPTQSLLQKWLREVKGENITPPLFFSYQGYACDTYDCGWTMDTVWWYEDKQCWMTTGAVESTEAHLPYTYWRKLPPFPNEV